MNAINQLFERKSGNILSVYFTAGFPELADTVPVIDALMRNGVDMIEVGMPYSDPVADGPVIEAAGARALANGMSIGKLFEQLREMKPERNVPLILMGYLNPVMQYGYEKFCKDAAACGISGLIIPDLPVSEYQTELRSLMEKYGLRFIFLVTPETGEERIRAIDDLSEGFIYAVSSSSVTGRDTDSGRKEEYFRRLKSYKLRNPVLAGFGVKDKATFMQACHYTRGAITGTAFIKSIESGGNFDEAVKRFVTSLTS